VLTGRSSDLSLLANAFPKQMFQWLGIMFATYSRDLQQRVLSGIFTPVPFSLHVAGRLHTNQSTAKIILFLIVESADKFFLAVFAIN